MKKTVSTIIGGLVFGVALCLSASFSARAQTYWVKTQSFIVPNPSSASYVPALQNVMGYVAGNWSVGLIPVYSGQNPAGLHPQSLLRPCEFILTSFPSWDSTNAPTGTLAGEFGSEVGWAYDIRRTNLFLANAVPFASSSIQKDGANTMGYTGNVATNTVDGTPLTFGDTFRGQVWSNGVVIADYHSGESSTNPVNRLFGVIRLGWDCLTTNDVANDLNYSLGAMQMTNRFVLTLPDGSAATNEMSTLTHCDMPTVTNGIVSVDIEGQRHLGLYYSLIGSTNLSVRSALHTVVTNGNEGVYTWPLAAGGKFFFKQQTIESSSPVTPLVVMKTASPSTPRFQVNNDVIMFPKKHD